MSIEKQPEKAAKKATSQVLVPGFLLMSKSKSGSKSKTQQQIISANTSNDAG